MTNIGKSEEPNADSVSKSSETCSRERGRFAILDGFRGLAILWIVCYHLLPDVQKYYDPALDTIIAHGFLGVSIFFVISGYGIASSIDLS